MSNTVHNLLSLSPPSRKIHYNEKLELELMKQDRINIEHESDGLLNKSSITHIYLDMDRGIS